jgi:uncharacterized membrane protein YkoI
MMRAILLLTAMGFAGPALAAEGASHSINGTVTQNFYDPRDIARKLPMIPLTQASEIALRRVPGTVSHAEIETNDGIRTWQVDVESNDRRHVRLWLNANTGAFLRMVER